MPHPSRLRSSRDFRRVLASGARASAGPVQAVVAQGEPGQARVGITVGRTVGKAVVRNRFKRRVRAIASGLDLPAGTDAVVVLKPGVTGKTFQEMEALVAEALVRAHERSSA